MGLSRLGALSTSIVVNDVSFTGTLRVVLGPLLYKWPGISEVRCTLCSWYCLLLGCYLSSLLSLSLSLFLSLFRFLFLCLLRREEKWLTCFPYPFVILIFNFIFVFVLHHHHHLPLHRHHHHDYYLQIGFSFVKCPEVECSVKYTGIC